MKKLIVFNRLNCGLPFYEYQCLILKYRTMKFRDLEKMRLMIKEATDLDISYAFDDLVFPDHTAFIIQYSDEDDHLFYSHFHHDCIPQSVIEIQENLEHTFSKNGCCLIYKGKFLLGQKNDEVEIRFKATA